MNQIIIVIIHYGTNLTNFTNYLIRPIFFKFFGLRTSSLHMLINDFVLLVHLLFRTSDFFLNDVQIIPVNMKIETEAKYLCYGRKHILLLDFTKGFWHLWPSQELSALSICPSVCPSICLSIHPSSSIRWWPLKRIFDVYQSFDLHVSFKVIAAWLLQHWTNSQIFQKPVIELLLLIVVLLLAPLYTYYLGHTNL